MKPLRYALIGLGRVSPNHFNAAIKNNLHLVAVCDVNDAHIDERLAQFHIQKSDVAVYHDYREMIEKEQLDLVAIATDSLYHAEIALACIAKGINIIVEKPIAMSMDDADTIVAEAEKKGVAVCACHQNRFNTAVQKARVAMESGRFGQMSHGAIVVRWSRDKEYYAHDNWRGKWLSDGGTLMNQCIHGIDLLRWMMGGDVVEVSGYTARRQHPYIDAEDVGVATLKFSSGALATVEGTVNTFGRDVEETLSLFGDKGMVQIGGTSVNEMKTWEFAEEEHHDTATRQTKEATVNVYGNGHESVYADVIDAIQTGRAPYIDAKAGRDALEIVLAIYKSAKEGKPVTLPIRNFGTKDMLGHFDQ